MKRVVQAAGVLIALLLIAAVAVPSHVEITVTPVRSDRGAVSGWVESETAGRIALHGQRIPWEHHVTGRHMTGRLEAQADVPIRVRAVLFKGTLRLSELELVGTRVSLRGDRASFGGRAGGPPQSSVPPLPSVPPGDGP